jgi:regulation of enolase protein 1 (concanavalin A-like superfamily)
MILRACLTIILVALAASCSLTLEVGLEPLQTAEAALPTAEMQVLPAVNGQHDYDAGAVPSSACNAGGWAIDPDFPDEDVNVRIIADGIQVVDPFLAQNYREDLEASWNEGGGGCPGGTCAFEVSLWGLVEAQNIQSGNWYPLNSTPRTLTCRTPTLGPIIPLFWNNLALGKPVQASRSNQYPRERAVDAKLDTSWGAGAPAPQWIEVDLGEPAVIELIRLVIAQSPAGETRHQIWVGPTQNALRLVHTFEGNTADMQALEFRPEAHLEDVRYVRVVTTASPSWVGWREIEVIAAPSATSLSPARTPAPTASLVPTDTSPRGETAGPTRTPLPPGIVFWDDFDDELQPGWEWLRENDALWSLNSEPGFMRIVLEGAALPRNLLLTDVGSENFQVTTRVLFEPTSNFQAAGLTVYQDDQRRIWFGRAYCDTPNVCVGNGVYFDVIKDGNWFGTNFGTDTPLKDEAYLRLEKVGSMVTAYYSEDGAEWQKIGQHIIDLTDPKVGLLTSGSHVVGQIALFDYFGLQEMP